MNLMYVYDNSLFYIFFIYGLSFLVMFAVTFSKIKKAAHISLVDSFWMLAFFGLTHGLCEWTDWIRLTILFAPDDPFLLYVSQILLMASFYFLFQFAINLLTFRAEDKRWVRVVPPVMYVAFLVMLIFTNSDSIGRAGLICRYLFGFSGAFLSFVAFLYLKDVMRPLAENLDEARTKKLMTGLSIASVGFAAYAVFGGLIVRPIAGIPVQFFRTVCAVTISFSVISILEIFEIEV